MLPDRPLNALSPQMPTNSTFHATRPEAKSMTSKHSPANIGQMRVEANMWPRTNLIDLLGIEHPIIQAPMGGAATPALAIAVSNAGGLGGLGCSFMSPDELRTVANELRSGTNRPFNLNFFAHPAPKENPHVTAQMRARVAPFYKELGLENVPERGKAPYDTFNETKLSALLDIRPKVTSF